MFVAVKDSSHIETDSIFVADKLTIEKLHDFYAVPRVLSNKLTT